MFNVGEKKSNRYASLSARSWAITIDSVLFMVCVLPIFEIVFTYFYPIPELYTDEFIHTYTSQSDGIGRLMILWEQMLSTGNATRWLLDTLLQIFLLFFLSALCWKRWSATPGKMLVRIKIVDEVTSAPISNKQIVLRLLGYIISVIPAFAGFFLMVFSRRNQGWHDKIAGTVVVKVGKKNS